MHVILKWSASSRRSLSIFTSRFQINFNCTVYSGSFTLKFGAERPTRLFVLGKLNFTSLFIKANCSSTKFNFDRHMTRVIHGFTFTRPEYSISQFKCSFLRDLVGFVFLRAFTVYYRILEYFFLQTSSSLSKFRRPYFLRVQESSLSLSLSLCCPEVLLNR